MMETIKINEKTYQLVADGYQMQDDGGRVIFMPSDETFTSIKDNLTHTGSIEVMNDSGEPIISRSDLVYAGRLTVADNYIIGSDSQGQSVTGTVMIAEFRVPDVREQCAALEAKLEYMAMMADIDLEV
jgi:hypothetical protein